MKNTKLMRGLVLGLAILFMIIDVLVPFKANPVLDICLWAMWLTCFLVWMRMINKKTEQLRSYTEALIIERHIMTYTHHLVKTGILPDDVLTTSASRAYIRVVLKDPKYDGIEHALK